MQEASNQQAIFDVFYQDVVPDESLCIAYAKQVPFIEDSRRVIIGMGHIKRIIPAIEHKHTDAGSLRSMTWETMVCHSIRDNHKDGFLIPYQEMMKYADSVKGKCFSPIPSPPYILLIFQTKIHHPLPINHVKFHYR